MMNRIAELHERTDRKAVTNRVHRFLDPELNRLDDEPNPDWLTYEDQLPPDLLARVEEHQRQRTLAKAEPMTDEEIVEYLVLGGYHDQSGWAALGWMLTKGGGWHQPRRNPTGFPPGRPSVVVKPTATQLATLRMAVGVSREDFRWAVRGTRARRTAERQVGRELVARAIATATQAGRGWGMHRLLAAAYGCAESTIARLAREGRGVDEAEVADRIAALGR